MLANRFNYSIVVKFACIIPEDTFSLNCFRCYSGQVTKLTFGKQIQCLMVIIYSTVIQRACTTLRFVSYSAVDLYAPDALPCTSSCLVMKGVQTYKTALVSRYNALKLK